MTTDERPTRPSTAASEDLGSLETIRVWDVPTRLFHWVLVLLLGGLWYTGQVSAIPLGPLAQVEVLGWRPPILQMPQHMLLGQGVLVLIVWRLIYGLFGTTTARFAAFVRGPRTVLKYLRTAFGTGKETAAFVLGHNPAGGWMVLALLAVVLAQAATGLYANDDIFSEGPLATTVTKATSDMLTGWHKTILFPLLQALVALHVAAAFFYLFVKGENLIRAMVTGRKTAPAHVRTEVRFASPLVALSAAVVAVLVVYGVVEGL